MNLDLSTPALLFPAISLLLLAYTNRYLALATVVRGLSARAEELNTANVLLQVKVLYQRIYFIRYMQIAGILSILMCVISMATIWMGLTSASEWTFGGSLLLMSMSLILALVEVSQSGVALSLELDEMRARLESHPSES
jgi:hypothetical protein